MKMMLVTGGTGGHIYPALALADAFQCGVNDLPLSLVLCWPMPPCSVMAMKQKLFSSAMMTVWRRR